MKFAHLTVALCLLPAASLLAQAPSPSPTPSVSSPVETGAGASRKAARREMMENLTPEEKQKLKTARKAAQDDPAVKAAEATKETNKRGYHEAVRAAMLKSDPSVGAIFSKMKAERREEKLF